MSDATITPAQPVSAPFTAGLVDVLLNVSLTGMMFLRPHYAAQDQRIIDFTWERLNPVAQRILQLSEHPTASLLTLFPSAEQVGVFNFYRDAFLSGQVESRQNLYQHDGLDGYYVVAAQRYEELLIVSFTDATENSSTLMQEELRASQAREQVAHAKAERQRRELERVFEQAPTAIAVYRGPQYIIELANPTVCRLWGRTPQQIVGLGLFEALPEVAGMGYEELLDRVMATGEPYVAHAMEAQHDRDGKRDIVYWDFVYVPMYGDDGRIDGAMVVANEVTEQVRARLKMQQLNEELEIRVTERTAQLAEQQHMLRQILGQVPAAIATLTGPTHRFAFVNSQYQQLVAGRAVLGRPVSEVLPDLAEQGFVELLDQVYASNTPYEGKEVATLLPSPHDLPSQRYFNFTYQPLTDGHGHIHGILSFSIEVTEQIRARQQADTLQAAMLAVAQRQAQERQELYQIFAQTPVAIVLLREPDHRIDYFNPAFEVLFPPEEWTGGLHGHTVAHVYPRLKIAGLVQLLDQVYITGEPQVVLDMPLAELQPGSPRYVTFAYQAYREQERIVGVAAFVYDVTEQVVARQQVQALNQELATANRELVDSNTRLSRSNADLDSFVYSASHDLKSPIANIEGLLQALYQDLPAEVVASEVIAPILSLMSSAIARFQQTLVHLTNIVHLERSTTDLVEEIELAALIQNVCLDAAPTIEATRAQLLVTTHECPRVRVAPQKLRSIIFNLLSNALKYRSPERTPIIQVRATCSERQIRLEVQDNGLGLTPAQQGQLFRLFRRLHPGTEGSGVGLYTVKKIVDNAGGTITVQSEAGTGTTFTILLPGLTAEE